MQERQVSGNNNSDLTEMNRSVILRAIKEKGICSRSELANLTGLTNAAISKIISALLEIGIVRETGLIKGNANRRSIGLQLNGKQYQVIGVKFARHMFAVGVFDITGKVYEQCETSYEIQEDYANVIEKVKQQIRTYINKYPNIVAIGCALPGPYLRHEGRIAVITQMSRKWHNVDFISEFKDAFRIPVFLEHDANSGALAEWWFGNHSHHLKTLIYFLVGEGVGAGIVEQGRLLLGTDGTAGEIGHISIDVNGPVCECGNYGCLELYCCAGAILQKYAERIAPGASPIRKCKQLFEAARNGDRQAIEIVQETARYIGYGCVMLINAYNPDMICIGDIVSEGSDLMLDTIRNVVKERVIPELYRRAQIRITDFEIDPILYGAAALATDEILRVPSAFAMI